MLMLLVSPPKNMESTLSIWPVSHNQIIALLTTHLDAVLDIEFSCSLARAAIVNSSTFPSTLPPAPASTPPRYYHAAALGPLSTRVDSRSRRMHCPMMPPVLLLVPFSALFPRVFASALKFHSHRSFSELERVYRSFCSLILF